MPWQKARFKDQEVWAKVSADGTLVVEQGRVEIRYQESPSAKIYRAGAARVEPLVGSSVQEVQAEKSPTTTKAGVPGGFGKAGRRTEAQKAMAADAAKTLIDSLHGKAVLCFTDGACKGNPGPAGSGAAVWFLDGRIAESSLALGKATNNVAELTAIGLAIDLLEENRLDPKTQCAVFTDSSYAHGVLSRGWKAKANQALVEAIKTRVGARPNLSLYWVAGHVGVEGNERADALANAGVMGVTQTQWLSTP